MNCEQVTGLLFEYQERNLSSDQLQAVHEHLGSCHSCNRELKSVRALLEQTKQLNSGVEPRRDLWAGIRQRIEADSQGLDSDSFTNRRAFVPMRSWGRWLGMAAMLGFLGLTVVLVGRWPGGESADSSQAVVSRVSGHEVYRMSDSAAQARVADGAMQTKKDLLQAIERERVVMEPEAVANVESSIQLIDMAIGETRLALEEFPQSRYLNHRLANLYRSESDLLKRLSRV
jgi:hypothetical protein